MSAFEPEQPAEQTYDNAFMPDSVYGHALGLLARHRTQTSDGALHLDIGCGYGRIAEPLTKTLGLHYVGCDDDSIGLASLASRGFETSRVRLLDEDTTYAALRAVVANRPIASVSMLDTLEHLPNGMATLRALSRLAAENNALVVISVPNVAHADIAAKLLLGRLDITDVGLLDHTHLRIFTAQTLDAELRAAGLYPFDSGDTHKVQSDQHFPEDHPLLASGTELGLLVRTLRESADPGHAGVFQLVRICAPGPMSGTVPWVKAYENENRPFLTIVMRTQGRRLHTLREALLCLHGQTDPDIEVLVMGHRLEPAAIKAVERVIDDQPEPMRFRTRLIQVLDGGRTRPLNVGFAEARGRYVSILDDDDIPFAHWVETFRKLHDRHPGCVLRCSGVRQSVRNVTVQQQLGLRGEGAPERIYPPTFDILEHLRTNHTPPVAIAFPRGAFHDLGLHFDENLTTTEDWDYLMRVALLVGAESSQEITSVYRWWEDGESSRDVHSQEEWDRNHATILRKMDSAPLLLPVGSAWRLRYLLDAGDRLRAVQLQPPITGQPPQPGDADRIELLRLVSNLYSSNSWLLSSPLRLIGRLTGRRLPNHTEIWSLSTPELQGLADAIRQTLSWKITAPLRRAREVVRLDS
ncbi:MAG: methyltransferase domain-containing protein [Rhodopila sp.]|nr:methyltransferase domain-containing protein [Rhodopila sp.]